MPSYEVSLFYFTGHGVQEDKEDYLLPVDISLTSTSSLKYAIWLKGLLNSLAGTACKTNIVFVNCCRDTRVSWSMSPLSGYLTTEVPQNFAMLQSTRSGDTANDWVNITDKYSPFTAAFLEFVGIPGEELSNTINDIKNSVYNRTGGVQSPYPHNQIYHSFSFCHKVNNPVIDANKDTNVSLTKDTRIFVSTVPRGATVFIDGKEMSIKSDLVITKAAPGTRTIKCVLDGYESVTEKVTVVEGKDLKLEYKLTPLSHKGIVSIRTTPSSASVWIDGKSTQQRQVELDPGYHKIEAQAPGYKRGMDFVRLTGDDNRSVYISLEKTFWNKFVNTFSKYTWYEYGEIGLGYYYVPNYPLGMGLSLGFGPLEFGVSYGLSSFNKKDDQYIVQKDASLWFPDFCFSFNPGIKFSYLGLGLGLGVESGRWGKSVNVDSLFPYSDNDGKRFRIDNRANVIYSPSQETVVDPNYYFIITPNTYLIIPLWEVLELYGGAGYTYCPKKKERSGVSFMVGLRFNVATWYY